MLVVQWCALPPNILIIMFDFCSSLTPQHTVIDSCVDVCITMYLRMHVFRNKDSSKTTLAGKYLLVYISLIKDLLGHLRSIRSLIP